MSLANFIRFMPAGLGGLLLVVSPATACGPDFPNAYLANTFDEITTLPTLDFESEVARVFPLQTHTVPDPEGKADEQAEIAEVRAALTGTGLSAAAIEALMANYRRDAPPTQLPSEFHLYSRGAKAWHAGKIDDAVACWQELLALPEKQRHYRTVWATYMLQRAGGESDPVAAREACHRTETAAAQGFADSQRLAAASLGWEARTHLLQGAYDEALRLYARQFQAGAPGATASLQFTLRRAFHGEVAEGESSEPDRATQKKTARTEGAASFRELTALAADPQLRGIVTAWFVARGGPHAPWSQEDVAEFQRWIQTLRDIRDLTPAESDRWCWAAYQNGLWDDAAKLASQAPTDAPAAEWVRAMLLLRKGFLDEAATHLTSAARAFPADRSAAPLQPQPEFGSYGVNSDAPVTRLAGVRGTLALRREQFSEALRLFLEAGHWSDAAYVAEQVLTLGELASFVRLNYPGATVRPTMPADSLRQSEAAASAYNLRYLLARRLTREARFDQAREFFPEELRGAFDRYVTSVRAGYAETLSPAERAGGFWLGAKTIREQGMELLGTELEPDYAIWGGSFQWPDFRHLRNQDGNRYFGDESLPGVACVKAAGVLAPTPEEYARAEKIHLPSHRFHYRYRAAELAWLGASLLPNDDPQAALMLNTAGRWLAAHDPERADLFYKTLVLRCPHTDLGRQAAARRWLVPEDEVEGGRL